MKRTVLLALVLACGGDVKSLPPQGQIVLSIDTDALVTGDANVALFDTLSVEIFPPGLVTSCDGCTRDFEADTERFSKGQVSVGIPVKPHSPGYRARVRLFRRANSPAGLSIPTSTIEVVAEMPEVSEEGIVPVSVFLETDSLGVPQGTLKEPIAATPGASPTPSRVGTWTGGQRVACKVDPIPNEEVCIEGGAFWLGNLRVIDWISTVAYEPRLVVLSPYILKTTEVNVGEYRKYSPSGSGVAKRGGAPIEISGFCSFTPTVDKDEGRALNCVASPNAQYYCKAHGGDLPTEAQLEFAAGRFKSTLYPWGDDDPSCTDAIWGRSPPAFQEPSKSVCLPADTLPAVTKSGAADRVPVGNGEIFDLGGNVEEWGKDGWEPRTGPCWAFTPKTNILYDPYCPFAGGSRVAKGGSWERGANGMAAASRDGYPPSSLSIRVGFRCARPGQ